MAAKDVRLAYADGTGSFLVLLAMAEQQKLFQKYGMEVLSVPIKGATVPRLTTDMPLGLIGEPAALLQAAEGADLRLVASFSDIKLSGHLVARPGIKMPSDLRGKRLGARVIGAGLWISTVLALEQLALDPRRDEIAILPVGNPMQIFRALEHGEIDAALVSAAQSRELQVKGFNALLKDYPPDISSFGGGLVVSEGFLSSSRDVVAKVVHALLEALAMSLGRRHKAKVMQAFNAALSIADEETAASSLNELRRKPYPSLAPLAKMQRVISIHDPRVLNVSVTDLIDDQLVRKFDESGELDALYAIHSLG
ncbi:MAG: ABC transporter substrate-binding protein [Hyphomicrobiaceae bacterium]|nr:ABC transporter substrate-binding protein [Hyphomicrobiaceae bacterium]